MLSNSVSISQWLTPLERTYCSTYGWQVLSSAKWQMNPSAYTSAASLFLALRMTPRARSKNTAPGCSCMAPPNRLTWFDCNAL